MSSAPRVFLVFDGAWHEVDASLLERRGGLRAFAREAESKWDLQPNSYEFHHAGSKVDSLPSLKRVVENSARDGVCQLEIHERAEGKLFRTMRKEMEMLEDRVMIKIDAALTDIRQQTQWNDSRLSCTIAPLVQSLATEHIELRNKLCQLDGEVDVLKSSSATFDMALGCKDAARLELEFEQDLATLAASELDACAMDKLEDLREEVCQLDQKHPHVNHVVPIKTTLTQEHQSNVQTKQMHGNPDAWLQWPTASLSAIPYSVKACNVTWDAPSKARWQPGNEWGTLLAQSISAPQLHSSKSMFGHRSCPLLPPLH